MHFIKSTEGSMEAAMKREMNKSVHDVVSLYIWIIRLLSCNGVQGR